MLAAIEQSESEYMAEKDTAVIDISYPSAPPAYPADSFEATGSNALTLLTNAVASSTGATEAQKNEKAAFGAISELMRDDANTRKTKVIVFNSTSEDIKSRIEKGRRWRTCFSCLRLVLIFLFFSLCMLHVVIEAIPVENYKGILKTFLPQLNVTAGGESDVLTISRHLNVIYTLLEILISTALMFVTRTFNRILSDLRLLKRDLIKRETYISMSKVVESDSAERPPASR
uniref:Nonstructural protein NS3 n=2 Tax=Mudumu virus TaxID=2841875 RepID=A0A8E8V2P7_9REOV|nr:nonstructural protein NS3 [Mudumu virus]